MSKDKTSLFSTLFWIAILGVAISMLWRLQSNEEKPQVKPENRTTKVSKNREALTSTLNVISQPPPPMQTNQVAAAPVQNQDRQIPKDHVEFEILSGNIAVAFGDVVLGRLDSELKTPKGIFKPPKSRLWPTSTIPFLIREGTPNPQFIMEALKYFSDHTTIQFIERTDERDGIMFEPWDEKRCSSYIGAVGGLQPIFIGPECGTQVVIHEIMHALGFVHEQSRVDRDKYIRIVWENIIESFFNQFDIVPDAYIHPYTGSVFNFDFESVMLYPPDSFAKTPGTKTIEVVSGGKIAPVTQGLSAKDLERLHYLY